MACHMWHAIDIFSPQRMSYIRNIKNAVALGNVPQGHGKCFSASGGQCLAATVVVRARIRDRCKNKECRIGQVLQIFMIIIFLIASNPGLIRRRL